ncbi:MAG: DUF2207 domain-containing protein [Oscillospiraceae bacterium]|nr:DUF2207 domain-containing protein [Oscillospiraceae bacterium]
MRKLICLLLCFMMLAVPVLAFDGITSVQSQTVVGTDGACQVSLTATLQLSASSDIAFPLPENASDIAVNLPHARITRSGGHRNVDLSSLGAGSHTLTFRYTLPDAVTADENGDLTLTVPLVCGFALPIEQMTFSIELPGAPERRPTFSSTYYLETAESIIDCEVQDNVITGVIEQRLQDRESLTMTLAVSKDMFPHVSTGRWSMDAVDLIMAAFFFLALAYWLITMRCLPPRRSRRALPTPGLNAGEIPCRLSGQGMDLTLAVLSWAQMGYILIQADDHGRVLLHKRMEMGNERGELENRLFRSLFGKKNLADATGYRYATLCRKAMTCRSGVSLTYKRASGNPRVFRFLAAAIGTFGGVSMAYAFANDTAWQIVLAIFLGILGSFAAWQMQSAAKGLFHPYKLPLLIGLGCGLVWFLLSLLAGEWHTGLFVVLSQWLAGLAAAFGGRKTESGQQNMSEILGLRRFMHTAKPEELQRILDANPHYFYDLAPYALALDADRAFARRFGNVRLPECPYLTTGMDGHMTVKEWDQLLRSTAESMDALQRRLPLDRLLGR